MRSARTPVLTALAAASALLLGACSGSTPAASGTSSTPASSSSGSTGAAPHRLAAVIANLSDPFWATVACSAQAEAKTLGVDLKLYSSQGSEDGAIAQNFDAATLEKPDGLLVTPFNNNQFATQYGTLMSSGVPVVSGNGSDPQAEYLSISSGGDTSAFVKDVLPMLPTGAGSMVYLGGAPGIPPLESRTLPFTEALAKARPDLTRLPNDYSGFDINKSTSNVNALILANPDLKVIIASNGPDGQAAAAALQQSGKVGKIALVAFDAVPAEVDALRAGTITALIAQAPGTLGAEQVKALVDYLDAHPDRGPVTPAGHQEVPSGLLTAKNIDDPANAPYIYKTGC